MEFYKVYLSYTSMEGDFYEKMVVVKSDEIELFLIPQIEEIQEETADGKKYNVRLLDVQRI